MKAICMPYVEWKKLCDKGSEVGDKNSAKNEKNDCGRYYQIYGLWFYGEMEEYVKKKAKELYKKEFTDYQMHVYLDAETVSDGIHDVDVYEIKSRLYKWTADGYQRGLIVKADNANDNTAAQKYMGTRSWSWRLCSEEEKEEARIVAEQVRIGKEFITNYSSVFTELSKK